MELQTIVTNIGLLAAALLAIFWVAVKIWKGLKEDRAESTLAGSIDTLYSGMSEQYQLFVDANRTMSAELIEMRRNNIALQAECDNLRSTIVNLRNENVQLVAQIDNLKIELQSLKKTIHQLTASSNN